MTERGIATEPKPWTTIEELRRNNLENKAELAVMFGFALGADGEILPPIREYDGEFVGTMAAVMYKAGAFASVADAKRNGWNRPIERGLFSVGKGMNAKRIRI